MKFVFFVLLSFRAIFLQIHSYCVSFFSGTSGFRFPKGYDLIPEENYEYPAENGCMDYVLLRDQRNSELGRCFKLYNEINGKRFYFCDQVSNCTGSLKIVICDGKVYEPSNTKHQTNCKTTSYKLLKEKV